MCVSACVTGCLEVIDIFQSFSCVFVRPSPGQERFVRASCLGGLSLSVAPVCVADCAALL